MGGQRRGVGASVAMLLAAGCMLISDVRVPDRVIVPNDALPALDALDVHQASLRLQPQTVTMARRLESELGIDRQIWNLDLQRALTTALTGPGRAHMQAVRPGSSSDEDSSQPERGETPGLSLSPVVQQTPPANSDIVLSPHLNRITAQTRRVAWNGHVFFFLSIAVDSRPEGKEPRRHHVVHVLHEQGAGTASFKSGAVEPSHVAEGLSRSLPSQPLNFDVVVADEGPWIVYRDREGIFARPLTTGSGLGSAVNDGASEIHFGEAVQVSRARLPVGEFQFISRIDGQGALHVLWTDQREHSDLWHCRFDLKQRESCRRPTRLSRSVSRQPINLMVQGDDVYVSWIDSRYSRGFWDKRNFAKLFLAKSRDGGRSFGQPISIHEPDNRDELPGFAMTLPAPEGGVLLFWGTEWRGHNPHDQGLHYGHLLPDMRTLRLAEDTVPGARLHDFFTDALKSHHRQMGGD
ncbi:hypothetical protein VCB98_12235 [Gammaproteobacteria bacterium AB-CW1]|uniref:Exo-alpha-sialidase n=1 Tax=Natronospira elongata TaxID=3110268 RepID=A0AAP6JH40_9GAMM|nr:hypothetical protein [Gammaproteobacteria bacterium AB-CW1]